MLKKIECIIQPFKLEEVKEPMGISGTSRWVSADNPVP